MDIILGAVLGGFALIGWLSYLRFQRHQISLKNGSDRFGVLLERFADVPGFIEAMQSEKGLQALATLTTPAANVKMPILVLIGSGIVLTSIGFGTMLLAIYYEPDMVFPMTFMFATGVGLLVAASVSYSLSRKWGIFEDSFGAADSDVEPRR